MTNKTILGYYRYLTNLSVMLFVNKLIVYFYFLAIKWMFSKSTRCGHGTIKSIKIINETTVILSLWNSHVLRYVYCWFIIRLTITYIVDPFSWIYMDLTLSKLSSKYDDIRILFFMIFFLLLFTWESLIHYQASHLVHWLPIYYR